MEIIYGINPLAEALKLEPCRLVSLAVAGGRMKDALHTILNLAAAKRIPVEFKEKREIDKLAGYGMHQGVVGFYPSFDYSDLNQIMKRHHPEFLYHLVLLLDGITDPQNLGALIRTAHCHGADGVIIPEHRSAAVTAAVIKASAGAALLTPVARVANLSRVMEDLKKQGFWIYGADTRTGQNIHGMTCQGHIGLVMGSEGRGMRPLIRKQCDFLVSVPMFGKVDSLNVAVAAGIILNDIVRKWDHVEGVE
ncbi:MAG: 23S rRNA (guanosine(2251)-2'-O)-methyltransferase RlmB [Pseudomonadota bacterium]